MLLGTHPVHSVPVTATPLLSLIQPFLLRPCVLPLRFCDPQWLHYIKKEKGKRNYLGVCGIKNIKPHLFHGILNKLEYMDANAATKKKLPLTGAQRNMRHTKQG